MSQPNSAGYAGVENLLSSAADPGEVDPSLLETALLYAEEGNVEAVRAYVAAMSPAGLARYYASLRTVAGIINAELLGREINSPR